MAQAKRDQNRVTVGMGVTDDADKTPSQLLVDPSTERLLIDITVVATSTPVLGTVASHDADYTTTKLGVYDDSTKTVSTLLIDSRNGYLYCDVLVE